MVRVHKTDTVLEIEANEDTEAEVKITRNYFQGVYTVCVVIGNHMENETIFYLNPNQFDEFVQQCEKIASMEG